MANILSVIEALIDQYSIIYMKWIELQIMLIQCVVSIEYTILHKIKLKKKLPPYKFCIGDD